MRIFPINSHFSNSEINYWDFLNEEVNSLKHYVENFKPRQKVLNEKPSLYSHEELINKNIIQPKLISNKNALVIFSGELKYNQGLINNFSAYDFVYIYAGNYSENISASSLKEIPSSYYIFSKSQLQDEGEKYQLIRTARGGSYYQWTYNRNEGSHSIVAQYTDSATDVLGANYILDYDFKQKRFYLYDEVSGAQQIAYKSFEFNANNTLQLNIKATNGMGWGGNNLINHDFVTEYSLSNKIFETTIMDETRRKGVSVVQSIGIPTYTIIFPKLFNDFKTKIKLW